MVVIILIATMIAIPVFRGTMKSAQMTDASRTAIRMARYARSMAILRQADCKLQFTDMHITLTCDDPDEPGAKRNLPEAIVIDAFETQAEGITSEKERFVYFYPSGMNDGFELTLMDAKQNKKTLICHPISGKVTIDE